MKKKILVGGLHHESDTFNPIITNKDDIWVKRGNQLINEIGQDSCSGIVKTLLDNDFEVVPTLIARAVPNGVWDKNYYLELKDELISKVREEKNLSAICLSLHGSMRVEGIGEAEGDILESIREIYPDILIVSSLDMHATVTDKMIKYCDAFVGYKCAPHTDTFETGVHAANIVIESLQKGIKPTMSAVHIPFLVAGEQSETSVEPMKSLIDNLREEEKNNDDIFALSYLLGFPWADTKENGVTSLVVTKADERKARDKAMELANIFWNKREDFCFYNETRMPKDALEKSLESVNNGIYPVVISDSGDNPTAGSSSDVTNFLKLILENDEIKKMKPSLIYQSFYDKEVVNLFINKPISTTLNIKLGAKYDRFKSESLNVSAKLLSKVKNFQDAENTNLILLDIEGVNVIVSDKHIGCYDPNIIRALGVEVEKRKIIVVKLGYLEPEIRSIAKRSMMALTTGSSDELFERLPYKKLKRPIYPLDKDFEPDLYYI
ncbi:MAG: M81 family metallopeptidase [Sphaerochaetaceae bacterium]|nr:M81 family metallopeptidase [Sphaerochaetaceae bacterium]